MAPGSSMQKINAPPTPCRTGPGSIAMPASFASSATSKSAARRSSASRHGEAPRMSVGFGTRQGRHDNQNNRSQHYSIGYSRGAKSELCPRSRRYPIQEIGTARRSSLSSRRLLPPCCLSFSLFGRAGSGTSRALSEARYTRTPGCGLRFKLRDLRIIALLQEAADATQNFGS